MSGTPNCGVLDGTPADLVLDVVAAHAAFRPDSQEIAVSYRDGTIRIHDPASGRELRQFPSENPDTELWWNPKYPILAGGGADRSVRLFDATNGTVLRVFRNGPAESLVWHPAGRLLAVSSYEDHAIDLWDTQTGEVAQPPMIGHRHLGIVMSFNHAGDRLLSNDWSQIWRLWDVRTGRQLLAQPAVGNYLQFSPDDRRAAASFAESPQNCHMFRFRSGSECYNVAYHDKEAEWIGFEGRGQLDISGRLLAIASHDGVVLVDIERAEVAGHLPLAGNSPLCFEPQNAALLTYGRGGLLRWPIQSDPQTGKIAHIGKPDKVLAAHTRDWSESSADGQVVAIPNYSRGGLLLHRGDQRTITLQPQSDVRCCAVSPDGRWVATGSHSLSQGSGAKVWDAQTGRLVHELSVGGICFVDFSPDGKWLGTTSGGLRLWSVGDWQSGPKLSELAAHFAFMREGQLLAVEDAPGIVRP